MFHSRLHLSAELLGHLLLLLSVCHLHGIQHAKLISLQDSLARYFTCKMLFLNMILLLYISIVVLDTWRHLLMVMIVLTERSIVDLPALYLLVLIFSVKCVVLGGILDRIRMVLIEVAIRLAKLAFSNKRE